MPRCYTPCVLRQHHIPPGSTVCHLKRSTNRSRDTRNSMARSKEWRISVSHKQRRVRRVSECQPRLASWVQETWLSRLPKQTQVEAHFVVQAVVRQLTGADHTVRSLLYQRDAAARLDRGRDCTTIAQVDGIYEQEQTYTTQRTVGSCA